MPKCPAAGKRSYEARFCGGIEVPSRRVSAGRDLAKFGGPLQATPTGFELADGHNGKTQARRGLAMDSGVIVSSSAL
jgi:hypothetical protein